MTARYVSQPRAMDASPPQEWWGRGDVAPVTVYEQEPQSRRTGLLDARGIPIFAVEDRQCMGFHL